MTKAELGSRIAGETAESLTAIIAGIQESDRLISEIARSSQEQAINISQVNDGVDQVAQVVQQNSATAEENAAASEEMSSQSSVLKQMVSKFQLAAGGGTPGYEAAPYVPAADVGSDASGFALSSGSEKY
jgi:methyl-accepting chemotaxis protein